MLAIFDQIASGQPDPTDGIKDIPADFPGMIDGFQQPVAYQQSNQRNDINRNDTDRLTQGDAPNSIVGRGRGRVFQQGGQPRDNGWNGQNRNRPRSEADFDWRKPGTNNTTNGEASPPNTDGDAWNSQAVAPNGASSPNNDWKAGTTGNANPGRSNNQPGQRNNGNNSFWNKGNQRNTANSWNNQRTNSKMPEWLDTETNEGGVFDNGGNFTEERRASRSFDSDIDGRPVSPTGPPPLPRSAITVDQLEKDLEGEEVFEPVCGKSRLYVHAPRTLGCISNESSAQCSIDFRSIIWMSHRVRGAWIDMQKVKMTLNESPRGHFT